MLRSTAVLATASPDRDADELLAVLGRGSSVRMESADPSKSCLVLSFGVLAVLRRPEALVLIAAAADDISLGLVEEIVGRSVADLDWHFASAEDRAVRLAAA
jgi:hypothetical protein